MLPKMPLTRVAFKKLLTLAKVMEFIKDTGTRGPGIFEAKNIYIHENHKNIRLAGRRLPL